MTNYNDGKWHGWNGGDCPVHPESVVETRHLFDGPIGDSEFQSWATGISAPAGWFKAGCWHHSDSDGSNPDSSNPIIAFRVVKEHKSAREFWLGCSDGYRHVYDTKDAAQTFADHNKKAEIIYVREVLE